MNLLLDLFYWFISFKLCSKIIGEAMLSSGGNCAGNYDDEEERKDF